MSDAPSPAGGEGRPTRDARQPRRVALTGGIATGKSHVLRQLAARGIPTIDSDVLAREAVAPGTAGLASVIARFGPGVVGADGALDRQALGTIVFADAAARRALEAIVHPAVRQATEHWFASLDPTRHTFAVADIPLLYEVGRDADFDLTVVAACSPEQQLRRVIERDGVTESEARQRIAAQWPIEDKARRADVVIRTDGSFAETEAQTDALVRALLDGTTFGRDSGRSKRFP